MRTDADHAHARGDAVGGVLDDDAVGRVDAERAGGRDEPLGVGLAARDVFGGDGAPRHRQARGIHPRVREVAAGRGDERVRQPAQVGEQPRGAGDRDDAVRLGRLGGEQLTVLGEVLLVRRRCWRRPQR